MKRNTDYQTISAVAFLITILFLSAAIIVNTIKISQLKEKVNSFNYCCNESSNSNNSSSNTDN